MVGGTHSQGVFGKLLITTKSPEDTSPFYAWDNTDYALEFLSESLSKKGRIIGGQGIRGVLSQAKERTREGPSYFGGEINTYCSPALLERLLDDVMGMTAVTAGGVTTFTVDENALPYFGILIDTDYSTFEFKDCKLDHWSLRSRAPQYEESGEPDMVYMTMGIIASDHAKGTTWPSPEPSIGTAAADAPYIFADTSEDTGIQIGGSEREIEEFSFRVDNHLTAKYTNSLLPHSIRSTNRTVRAVFRVPWNSTNNDLYELSVAGAAASIKLAIPGTTLSTKISFANFQVPSETPIIPGKDQISLVIRGQAYSSGSTKELIITNDVTTP